MQVLTEVIYKVCLLLHTAQTVNKNATHNATFIKLA